MSQKQIILFVAPLAACIEIGIYSMRVTSHYLRSIKYTKNSKGNENIRAVKSYIYRFTITLVTSCDPCIP